jgi:hypothetical protein
MCVVATGAALCFITGCYPSYQMKTLTTLLLATVLSGPAWAKEKCTSECHLFTAWAMARLCPNLTLIHTPETDATYREFLDPRSRGMRQLMADALRQVQQDIVIDPKHACHPMGPGETSDVECTGTEDDEGTVCQYVKEKGTK